MRRDLARLEAVELEAVGEVDARGSHSNDGALTAAAWLRMLTRATPAEATGLVRTARVLRTGVLPNTRAALAEGAISGRHAQVIADGVIDAPAGAVALIEPEAVAAAAEADVRAVANLMRAFGHALDPDEADQAALRRYDRAGITLSPTLDGSMAISGLADEVTGSLIATAIDTAAPLVPGDDRTAARRRLDGLADIARRYLADPDAPRRGGGGHPHLIVTVDQTTLHAAGSRQPRQQRQPGTRQRQDADDVAGGAGPGGTLSWIGRIAGSTAGRVGCDAAGHLRHHRPGRRRSPRPAPADGSSPPPNAGPSSPATATAAAGPGATGRSPGPTPTTSPRSKPAAPPPSPTAPCPAKPTTSSSTKAAGRLERLPDGRYLAHHPATGRTIGPEPHPPGHNRPPPARE